jgi:high-affinity nickel-transport protein
MVAVIVGLNVLGWVMLSAAIGGHYRITNKEIFGFGTGILAYTLGMRHAFDADHIAAIDNTTRKLVSYGKRPLSVGFFFLGVPCPGLDSGPGSPVRPPAGWRGGTGWRWSLRRADGQRLA